MIENLKFFGWMALSLAIATVNVAILTIPCALSIVQAIGWYHRSPATLWITVPFCTLGQACCAYWSIRIETLRQKIHTMVRRVYLGEGE